VVLGPEATGAFHRLKVDGGSALTTATVLTVERPQIKAPRYRLTGQVRYDNVEGTGYLEMWTHFPDGGQYFSRTLGTAGPMMNLQGSSGWRAFALPFDATGAKAAPSRLVVNVVLSGKGTVYLGPLELGEDTGADVSSAPDKQGSDLVAAMTGTLIGSVGALIGVLTALGRARRVVFISAATLILVGIVAFTVGIVAFARAQPNSVFFPLLLTGFLAAVIPLGLMPTIRRRYEELELRAMRAQDVR
jgi:hypothetical protein